MCGTLVYGTPACIGGDVSRLEIHLLGPLRVSLDGEPVTGFVSDKVRALLAYLAVEADQPHRREKLVGLLWPHRPEQAARGSLRTALANLRKEEPTDQDGHYEVRGLGTSRRSVNVYVKAEGYARAKQQLKVKEGQQMELDFDLQSTGAVEGLVVNTNGDGIKGARVEVKRTQPDSGTEQVVGYGTSRGDGTFVIADVEPGESLRVRVRNAAYLETHSEPFGLEPQVLDGFLQVLGRRRLLGRPHAKLLADIF